MTTPQSPPSNNIANQPLTPANIRWNEGGQPFSLMFQDVYFSSYDGLAESRYVFLQHNQLPERWRQLARKQVSHFVIGETGFGTGLNFLASWELWRQIFFDGDVNRQQRLHYISIEKHPLTRADLQRTFTLWPTLRSLSEQLLNVYPPAPLPGFHRLVFDDGAVTLTLIFNDVADALEQMQSSRHFLFDGANFSGVDAWYLDGFAPAKNPAMWNKQLMPRLAKLSRAEATVATYTSAGDVRRALRHAGFAVEKHAGFHGKREMLAAILTHTTAAQTSLPHTAAPRTQKSFTSSYPAPWFVYPQLRKLHQTKTALVVGAGLAGCHSARALAQRGWQVTVIDRHNDIAQEASGNPQGALYAKLSADDDALAQFNIASLLFAQRFYRPWWQQRSTVGNACGALYVAHNDNEQRVWQQLYSLYRGCDDFIQFLHARQASHIAGITIESPCILFPDSGWLSAPALCRALLDHANIVVQTATAIDHLAYGEKQWQAIDCHSQTRAVAAVAIVANASDARQFEHSAHLPLKSLRGQLSTLSGADVIVELQTVVCGAGYIAPAADNHQSFGASFSLHDHSNEETAREHRENIDNVSATVPSLASRLHSVPLQRLSGRVSFRCTTPDYLPIVGNLPDTAAFVRDFSALRKNANAAIDCAGTYLPDLYINVGHGSRGLAYTPLCAELLASLINNEPLPMSQALATALNPARFVVRDLIRNKPTPA